METARYVGNSVHSIAGSKRVDFFSILVFFYFLTLSVDLISIDISLFKIKLSHVAGCFMTLILLLKRKLLFFDIKFFVCFLLIFSSILISSFFSPLFYRSFAYCFIFAFNFVVYFLVPISLIYFDDQKRILRLYFASFFAIGFFAFLQFFVSFFGYIMPFVIQTVGAARQGIARGQGLSHEPSFFALYATPIVVFYNTYVLFLSRSKKIKKKLLFTVCVANIFLLSTTSTSAVFGYLVSFFVLWCFSYFSWIQCWIKGVKKRLLLIFSAIVSFLLICAIPFRDLFSKTFFKFFYYGFMTHISFADRFQGIVNALSVFCEHPFFGVGIGGVAPYLFLNDFYDKGPGSLVDVDRLTLQMLEPTNILTEILGSLGLYGFLVFMIFLAVWWKLFISVLPSKQLTHEERLTLLSFLISTVVMFICLQINMGLFRVYTWVHVGLGVGYVLKIKKSSNNI